VDAAQHRLRGVQLAVHKRQVLLPRRGIREYMDCEFTEAGRQFRTGNKGNTHGGIEADYCKKGLHFTRKGLWGQTRFLMTGINAPKAPLRQAKALALL
jgi:hypothetical protein